MNKMGAKNRLSRFKSGVVVVLVGFVLFTVGCVPNKKIVYVQDPGGENDIVAKDTVQKSFTLDQTPYYLQPRDVISINIFSLTPEDYNFLSNKNVQVGESMLSGYTVNDTGYVEIPVVGFVQIGGKTIQECELEIKTLLRPYLQKPTVVIKLLSFHFTILGEVNKPGQYLTYKPEMNILEGLAQCGDLAEWADRAKIKLLRQQDGRMDVVYLNLLEDKVMESEYFVLRPNDTIIVMPLKGRTLKKYGFGNVSLAISTISTIVLILWRVTR